MSNYLKILLSRRLFLIFMISFVFLFVSSLTNFLYAESYPAVQLTRDSGYVPNAPKIDQGKAAWRGSNYAGDAIFFYNGSEVISLVESKYHQYEPQIHNGQVVWAGYDGNDYEIFLFDGSEVKQLTNNNYRDADPAIFNGKVVWVGEDGNDSEIFIYDGIKVRQLTNDNFLDICPKIYQDTVVWQKFDGRDYEIYRYNGSVGIEQLTDNDEPDYDPSINGTQIAWYQGSKGALLLRKDDGVIVRLADHASYADHSPYIHNGMVVWSAYDGNDTEIFLYDGVKTIQITDNKINEYYPSIYVLPDRSYRIVWVGDDGNDEEIFTYDGGEIIQITDNNMRDYQPHIYNGQIVWCGYRLGGPEVFLANPIGQPLYLNPSSEYASMPMVGDLTGDGNLEIIFAATNGLHCVDNSGKDMWLFKKEYMDLSAPTLADLDGDGNLELLLTGENSSMSKFGLYCLDKNGQKLWDYEVYLDAIIPYPTAADLNNDGALEIIVRGEDSRYRKGNIYCFDKNGKLLWRYQTDFSLAASSHPAIADVNNDGRFEIIVGSTDGFLYCIDNAGKLVWKFNAGADIYSTPCSADIDADGILEIIFSTNLGRIYCVSGNGILTWAFDINTYPISLTGNEGFAAVDLNHDGNLEILFTGMSLDSSFYVYSLGKNGQLIWKLCLEDSFAYSSPVIADLDGNEEVEILISGGNGLYCVNSAGKLVWKRRGFSVGSPLAIADLDGDNNFEILFSSSAGQVYCINKDGQTFQPLQPASSLNRMPWPMFQHDLQRTGLYDRTPPTTPTVSHGSFVTSKEELYASWYSRDKESGIREYQYKIIENNIDGKVIRDWTSAGVSKYATAGGLELADGKAYYFAVRAKNGAGQWSEAGYSKKGVTVDLLPVTISNLKASYLALPNSARLYKFAFALNRKSRVIVGIYNSKGQLIRQLLSGVEYNAGNKYLYWDSKDSKGAIIPKGTYRVRVIATASSGKTSTAAKDFVY